MIAEIPTVAIEKVNLYQNTSIIADEVLVHRLGLVPLKIDPSLLEEKLPDEEYNERNHIKLLLHVKCEKINGKLENEVIYASNLTWVPFGNQRQKFKEVKPVFDNVIIAKLRENQEIECELICEKNQGRVHAKWSPVATAYYRLLPDIALSNISGKEAQTLKALCPTHVFDI